MTEQINDDGSNEGQDEPQDEEVEVEVIDYSGRRMS
jgi:hypothetical protein